ncbi:RNA polymerase factor sigma-54 [Campylobacter sp. MIT 12-8780]|uniref:RNA polymerase factor sigma-54 n=1 Tax=unclassified Campylobacter TaxID=2593542 RepID=UPI00115E7EA3|nr:MULTISPECIES: RNA polymerase factor sigma-54 [unclassified Campylobacter]NDJ28161.1 RNA polymerase factor sigma-54 [Campylobacter sp. MIT 19-121]TQR42019.1 RNA polymerase factor sigma-54 [Campylobacter sp. MIT 12-8780]
MLKQKQSQSQKTKLSNTLRSWLPILQANIEDLKESLDEFAKENPFISVKENPTLNDKGSKRTYYESLHKNSVSDTLEALSIAKKSVYELLNEQIQPPLFPTAKSQEIALKIVECLNNEGYFEYDTEILKDYSKDEVERVRQRFKYLEPTGVGAVDFKEALQFALDGLQLDDELYEFCIFLIKDFENIKDYAKDKLYKEALKVLKNISTPPFLEYFEDSQQIVPDIFIYRENGEIKVKINDEYYPEISLETDGMTHEFLSSYIKDAKNLVDALAMRKATLYKVGLMIIEHQYDFFIGKEIKPMKLKDLADDLERNASTISRAIANKYLGCERGLVPLKYFFTTALDEDGETSNTTIKEYIQELIKNENQQKPLSDEKILQLAQNEFSGIQIGRRAITKYRKQLGIASSSDRKKIYELS